MYFDLNGTHRDEIKTFINTMHGRDKLESDTITYPYSIDYQLFESANQFKEFQGVLGESYQQQYNADAVQSHFDMAIPLNYIGGRIDYRNYIFDFFGLL